MPASAGIAVLAYESGLLSKISTPFFDLRNWSWIRLGPGDQSPGVFEGDWIDGIFEGIDTCGIRFRKVAA